MNSQVVTIFAILKYRSDTTDVPQFCHSNKHIIGYSYGPYFDGNSWTSEFALWIFSKYGGFIHYEFDELIPHRCHIFEASREKLIDYEATNSQTGLFCGLRMWKNVGYLGKSKQTMGPSLRIVNDSGEEIKGVLTTMHSISDNKIETTLTSNDNMLFMDEVSKETMVGQVEAFFDTLGNISLSSRNISNDFVIVKREIQDSLKIGVLQSQGMNFRSISHIGDITENRQASRTFVYKSGQKTGHTKGVYINNINITYSEVPVQICGDGYTICQESSYILIFDSRNLFAMPGDSGSLCYIEVEGSIIGVGLLVEKICDRLFFAIPLVSITEYFERNNYFVEWLV